MPKHRRSKAEHAKIAESRYGSNYPFICSITHGLTNGICCCCLNDPSEEVHHVVYRDQFGRIKDREIPGVHVFPLCKKCHDSIAHSRINWRRYADESKNANTFEFAEFLKSNFVKLNGLKKRYD